MVHAIDINSYSFAPARLTSIADAMNLIIPLITVFAALVLLVMLASAAFTILTAGGDMKKIEESKMHFTFAIIGFIIIIASYMLVKLIGVITGTPTPL